MSQKFCKPILPLLCILFCAAIHPLLAASPGFGFTFLPEEPLYAVHAADPLSTAFRFQYIVVPDGGPDSIRASVVRDPSKPVDYYPGATEAITRYPYVYEDLPFQAPGSTSLYYLMKVGFNQSLLRMQWRGNANIPPLSIEFVLQGALNLVFNATGGTDMLGSDGIYFIGANGTLADKLSFRIGTHHVSGHYGDEILERLYTYGDNYNRFNPATPAQVGHVASLLNYVRQDTIVASISYTPLTWLRMYGEADIPPSSLKTIRPWVHVPQDTLNSDGQTSMEDRIGGNEGNTGGRASGDEYDDSYRALRLACGIESRMPLPVLGDLLFALDVQFHQDGQTGHQVGTYDKDTPWDTEYNLLIGLAVKQASDRMEFTIEYIHHSGRFPLSNFFYVSSRYHSIGMSLKF